MTTPELEQLAKLVVQELRAGTIPAIAGAQLPSLDATVANACCEGHCPCDSRNGGQCPCNSKCGCDQKTAFRDGLDLVASLGRLPQSELGTVLEAAPVIERMRMRASPADLRE
jgi:hypothetical protein